MACRIEAIKMGRLAASASKKEFARQFALVVVTPTDRVNDMVARSGYVATSFRFKSRRTLAPLRFGRDLAISLPSHRPWSLFSAMSECFPNFVKGETLAKREGLQVRVFGSG